MASKLVQAIERIQMSNRIDEIPVYKEVCACPSRGGILCYDTSKDRYFGKGACSVSLLCAQIQIDKHQVLIKKTYDEDTLLHENKEQVYKEPLFTALKKETNSIKQLSSYF
ncbi:MAG: hypothetical protein ACTSYD_00275 [Candidatus Heimdallarchaeaceae archaeon]